MIALVWLRGVARHRAVRVLSTAALGGAVPSPGLIEGRASESRA